MCGRTEGRLKIGWINCGHKGRESYLYLALHHKTSVILVEKSSPSPTPAKDENKRKEFLGGWSANIALIIFKRPKS